MLKRIVTIQDISCFGKCSSTVALPLISAMGVEAAVIPTAVLSTHTSGFTGYTFRDLTADIPQIAAHWKGLDLHFDGIYTGYLGSREQVQIVADFFDLFRKRTPPSWWIRSWETAEKCMPDSRRTLPGKCESFAQKQT